MSLLHFNFSVPSYLPCPTSTAAIEVIQQIFIEYLLVPGTRLGLQERMWERGGTWKLPEPALHLQSQLAPLSIFTFSPIIGHCPGIPLGLLVSYPSDINT